MARSKFAIAFTLVGTVLSSAAHALGLGAIETRSALNQPLEARIPLISADPRELDSLSVSLASIEAFQRAGLERPFHLSQLKFEVVRGDRPYVRVSTTQPVKEPFLGFLVEANWPRGRLVREFTLLLDPPVYAPGGQPQAVIASAPAPSASAVPASAQSSAAVAPQSAVQISETVGGGEYAVRSSDTLWKVARALRPDASVTTNQMMVALFEANPHAFIDGDMNRLRRGVVLRVPDRAAVATTDAATASTIVRQHVARWRQDQAVAAGGSQPARGRLQVVAPEDSSGERATSSVAEREESETLARLRRELVLSEESVASLRAENEELKAQVAALRERILAMERAVNIETSQPVPGAVLVDSEPLAAVAEETGESVVAEAEPAVAEVEPAVADTEPAVAERAATESASRPAVRPPPAPEPGFFDDARNQGLLAAIAIALLALVYLVVRRRRKPTEEDAVAAPVEPEAPVEEALDEEPEPAEDEASAPGPEMPPENDPLGEAEVYLAYGRYDQAKEVVANALDESPARTDLRVKLLEILALTQDSEGFESHARALRAQVSPDDPAWLRVAEMGREFLPGNPLFEDGGENARLDLGEPDMSAAEPEADPDLGLQASVEQPAEEIADLEFSLDEAPETGDALEFTLDEAQAEENVEEDVEEDVEEHRQEDAEAALDFTLEEPVTEAPVDEGLDFSLDEEESALGQADPDAGLDFQLGESAGDENVVDFALPEEAAGDAPSLDELDEVSTKLDLARAYLDMGDSEGARSLLDEVLEEGNPGQKREAEELLRQIA